jgi:hypothetical protein
MMKVMAIGSLNPLSLEQRQKYLPSEVPATLQLYLDGKMEQFWLRDKEVGVIVVGILENPLAHAGKAYPLHGPIEYSHEELAAVASSVLGKNMPYEHLTVSTFLELLGIQDNTAFRRHFEAVTIAQQEGLLAGTDSTGESVIGRPSKTIEQFISEHWSCFSPRLADVSK